MGGQSCSFLLVQNYLLLSFLSIKVFWKLFHSKQPVFVKYLFTATLSACFGNMYFLRIHQIAGDWFHVNYDTKTIRLIVFRLLVLFMGILN